MPLYLKVSILFHIKRCAVAPTAAVFERRISQLKFYLQVETGAEASRAFEDLLSRRPSLPAPSCGSADIAKVASFGSYFVQTWIVGTKGAPPKGWAMCFREAERHGITRSTNNLAENGNMKVNAASRADAVDTSNHAAFIRWFLLWAIESGLPITFSTS